MVQKSSSQAAYEAIKHNTHRKLNSDGLIVSGCLVGFYKEWSGPWWCVASMGDGLSEGRKPFRGAGEVFSLPESSSGPQPAHPRSLTAARDCPAPGDHCTTHCDHGKTTLM